MKKNSILEISSRRTFLSGITRNLKYDEVAHQCQSFSQAQIYYSQYP